MFEQIILITYVIMVSVLYHIYNTKYTYISVQLFDEMQVFVTKKITEIYRLYLLSTILLITSISYKL